MCVDEQFRAHCDSEASSDCQITPCPRMTLHLCAAEQGGVTASTRKCPCDSLACRCTAAGLLAPAFLGGANARSAPHDIAPDLLNEAHFHRSLCMRIFPGDITAAWHDRIR